MTTDAIKRALAARQSLRARLVLEPDRVRLTIAALCMLSENTEEGGARRVVDYAHDLPGGSALTDVEPILVLLADARLCSQPCVSADDPDAMSFYLDYKARGEIALWGAGGWLGRMLSVDGAVEPK